MFYFKILHLKYIFSNFFYNLFIFKLIKKNNEIYIIYYFLVVSLLVFIKGNSCKSNLTYIVIEKPCLEDVKSKIQFLEEMTSA